MKMRIQGKVFQAMLTAWLMLVAIPNAVTAGPIEDGSAAYQRHDYETALRLLRGPAEQGSAEAQLLLGFMYHDVRCCLGGAEPANDPDYRRRIATVDGAGNRSVPPLRPEADRFCS